FQTDDGIRDRNVTGVQTCALPIYVKDVLLCSPQGITSQNKQFLNLYNTGYFLGGLNYKESKFERLSNFIELDYGHDFYAAQTLLSPDGRRILIGWMAMWENEMFEQVDGWSGALTLPRELILKDNQIYKIGRA